MFVLPELILVVYVENTETDACVGEVASDGMLDSRESLVGERVCSRHNGKDIDPLGEGANSDDVRGRKLGLAVSGVGRNGWLEDDALGLRLGVAVCAGARYGGREGRRDGGGQDVIRIEKVYTAGRVGRAGDVAGQPEDGMYAPS